jgi:hypothetical protein
MTRVVSEAGESSGSIDHLFSLSMLSAIAHERSGLSTRWGSVIPSTPPTACIEPAFPAPSSGIVNTGSAEVLDDAIDLWNVRANVAETTSAAPRSARDSDGRAVDLDSQPHT